VFCVVKIADDVLLLTLKMKVGAKSERQERYEVSGHGSRLLLYVILIFRRSSHRLSFKIASETCRELQCILFKWTCMC